MVFKVLIIGHEHDAVESLNSVVKTKRYFTAHHVKAVEHAIPRICMTKYDLLVFAMKELDQDSLETALAFRDVGYAIPILIVSQEIPKHLSQRIKKLKSVMYLEAPAQEKEFTGIAQKLICGRTVYPRNYKRFTTDTEAQVESFDESITWRGRIRNLSKGGAEVEMLYHNLKVGSLINLTVPLKKLEKTHRLSARVVWMNENSANAKKMLGLEFVKTNKSYKDFLLEI